jgi:hypothetical protein
MVGWCSDSVSDGESAVGMKTDEFFRDVRHSTSL